MKLVEEVKLEAGFGNTLNLVLKKELDMQFVR
jgi:hypothetical protein